MTDEPATLPTNVMPAASSRGAPEDRGPRLGTRRGAPDRRRLRPRHRDTGRTRDAVRLGQADHRRPRGVAPRVRPHPQRRADRGEPGWLRERQRPLEPVDRDRRPGVRRSGSRAVAGHRGVLGGRRAATVVRRCGALPPAPDSRDRVRHRQRLRRPRGAPRRSAERARRPVPGRSRPDGSIARRRDPAVAQQSMADHRLPRQRLAAAGRARAPRRHGHRGGPRRPGDLLSPPRDPDRGDPQTGRDRHGRHVHRGMVRRPAGDPRRPVAVGRDPDAAHRAGPVAPRARVSGRRARRPLRRDDRQLRDPAALRTRRVQGGQARHPRRGDQARLAAGGRGEGLGPRQLRSRRPEGQPSRPQVGRLLGVVRSRAVRRTRRAGGQPADRRRATLRQARRPADPHREPAGHEFHAPGPRSRRLLCK